MIRPLASIDNYVLSSSFGPAPALRILLDNADGIGAKIVATTKIAYDRKAERPITERQLDYLELTRFHSKILARVKDPGAIFLTLARFHNLALQLWFYDRGRWPLPPHSGLQVVRNEDREFANTLDVLVKKVSVDTAQCIQACEWLLRKLEKQ